MKVFWSWQSDTPGKIGRHFVRAALTEAVEVLKTPRDIEEPSERETREALHVDQDRQGVSGSPDLARTIFSKIEAAAVLIADVTPVGESMAVDDVTGRPKKLINSNVAIEYGYAERPLSDARILLVQNEFYGGRQDLPFDLRHKAGPIRYNLAPDASGAEMSAEKAKLRGAFVTALRPYLSLSKADPEAPFPETQTAKSPAYFAPPEYVLARVGVAGSDEIEYRLWDAGVFYLRLIPTRLRDPALKFTELYEIAEKRRLQTLSRQMFHGATDRNSFGAIVYEPHGDSPQPRSISQIFRNGELWSVGNGFHQHHRGDIIIPAPNVQNICLRVLNNFCDIAIKDLGVDPPYQIEIGGLGLAGTLLGVSPQQTRGPIHQPELRIRRVLNNAEPESTRALIDEFMDQLFDLAGADRSGSKRQS